MVSPDAPQHSGGAGEHEPYGVRLPHFGDNDHADFSVGYQSQVVGIMNARLLAEQAAREGVRPGARRGERDERHVAINVGGFDRPRGHFMTNEALLVDIQAASYQKHGDLTHNELARLAAANTASAVRPGFSRDAINDVNIMYFNSEAAYTPEAGLADVFSASDVLNLTFGAYIAEQMGRPGERLRVREFGASARTNHWILIAEAAQMAGVEGLDLTLTDFIAPPIPDDIPEDLLRTRSEAYSLHDDIPELRPAARDDVDIMTYVADSVWMADDRRITRMGDKWYRSVYRVKVADWSPRKDELLHALRTGTGLPPTGDAAADAKALEGIFVEEVMEQVDRTDVPYADFIEERRPYVSVNVPGGLITHIKQAFANQLHDDGMFISLDVADIAPPALAPSPSSISGVAERFKVEDYALAKRILETQGFTVEFVKVSELVNRYLPSDWRTLVEDYEREGIENDAVQMMVVRRDPTTL